MLEMYLLFSLVGSLAFVSGEEIPHSIYPKHQSGINRSGPLYRNISGILRSSQEECCSSSCCSKCDPAMIDPAEESPYYGTAQPLPGIVLATDKSDFKKMKRSGRMTVNMWMGTEFQQSKATTFEARYNSNLTMTVAVHNQFKKKLPAQYSKLFAKIVGRVPYLFRRNLKNLHLIPGELGEEACGATGHFKTGTVTLCLAEALDQVEKGTIEELLIHEGAHTTIDPEILTDVAGYACAMNQDQQFISTYARENPYSEDVAESVLVWYAAKYAADRLDVATKDLIEATIPHRLEYFDSRYAGQM